MMQTFKIKKTNGSVTSVIVSNDKGALDLQEGDRKIWLKENNMDAAKTQYAVVTVIKSLSTYGTKDYNSIA